MRRSGPLNQSPLPLPIDVECWAGALRDKPPATSRAESAALPETTSPLAAGSGFGLRQLLKTALNGSGPTKWVIPTNAVSLWVLQTQLLEFKASNHPHRPDRQGGKW